MKNSKKHGRKNGQLVSISLRSKHGKTGSGDENIRVYIHCLSEEGVIK